MSKKKKKKNKKLEIKIKYYPGTPNNRKLKKINVGDWIDLYAYKTTLCEVGKRVRIRLGVAMELPEGYEAYIEPRSSLLKNYGIVAPTSIIDNSYRGNEDEWGLECVCIEPRGVIDGKLGTLVKEGDRICQFRIVKSMTNKIKIIEVDDLSGPNRGGLGSTGTTSFNCYDKYF